MKKSKIAIAAFAAAVLATSAVGLAACGEKTDNKDGNDNNPSQTTYTVTFDATGGLFTGNLAEYSAQVKADGTVDFPADPTKTDFTFLGYNFKGDGSGTAVTESTVFTGNTTVFAIWEYVPSNNPSGDIPGGGGTGGDDDTQPHFDKDGIYIVGGSGYTVKKEFTATSTQFEAVNVEFTAGQKFVFAVDDSIAKGFSDGSNISKLSLDSAKGEFTVSTSGKFNFYFSQNENTVWVVDVTPLSLQSGDGIYEKYSNNTISQSSLMEFEDGSDQYGVQAKAENIWIRSQKENLVIKYQGNVVEGVTLENTSSKWSLSNGKLTLTPGRYSLYYKPNTNKLYVSEYKPALTYRMDDPLDSATTPNSMFFVGKFFSKSHNNVSFDEGVALTYDNENSKYSIVIDLREGDVVMFRHNGATDYTMPGFSAVESNSPAISNNKIQVNSDGTEYFSAIQIKANGIYEFVYIVGSAAGTDGVTWVGYYGENA